MWEKECAAWNPNDNPNDNLPFPRSLQAPSSPMVKSSKNTSGPTLPQLAGPRPPGPAFWSFPLSRADPPDAPFLFFPPRLPGAVLLLGAHEELSEGFLFVLSVSTGAAMSRCQVFMVSSHPLLVGTHRWEIQLILSPHAPGLRNACQCAPQYLCRSKVPSCELP